jgi:hypothetical protein
MVMRFSGALWMNFRRSTASRHKTKAACSIPLAQAAFFRTL